MSDETNDGFGDALDMHAQIIGMQAMRMLETALHRMKEDRENERRASEKATNDAEVLYESRAMLARKDLAPVMHDRFWQDADLDAIRQKYVTARAFAEVDDRFEDYRTRIEAKTAELHSGMTGDELLQGPVPAGPRPMTDEQMSAFINDAAPEWYKVWAQNTTASIDKIKDEQDRAGKHYDHAVQVRQDLEQWRDSGTLSANALAVQAAWEAGEVGGWKHRNVDPSERFKSLTEAERHAYGWREGGPKIQGPLDVDDARLLAATTAPGWYRLQDLVASDVPAAVRERLETRLVEDMTALRDTGKLDTASARAEWGRFTGHPMSSQEQDPNESLTDWHARRDDAFAVHWAATEPDRDRLAAPHGPNAGKPMSVAQAEEFAEKYAPDWVRDRHHELLAEIARGDDPEKIAYEQTNAREQFRYAMEEARDTNSLSHSYVAGLRDSTAFAGKDESEPMRSVPAAVRVQFGGAESRPMSTDEAKEVMDGWAPDWYKDQMRRTLRDNNVLGGSAKRSAEDSMRADMTILRDRGVLATDHAKRLWAASQPDFDPSDPDSRKAMDRREQLWTETMDSRPAPYPMDRNNRERLGGAPEAATQPLPVVPLARPRPEAADARAETPRAEAPEAVQAEWEVAKIPGPENGAERVGKADQDRARAQSRREKRGPVYDSVERREADASKARAAGYAPDEVDAMMAEDYAHPTRKAGGSQRPENFEDVRARAAHLAQQEREARTRQQ